MKNYIALFSMLSVASIASAEALYWVDGGTYFNATEDGKATIGSKTSNAWDIERKFNTNDKSSITESYNWATGYTIETITEDGKNYNVPTYTYAAADVVPTETTDVYFKYSEFSIGTPHRHRISGRSALHSDVTIKSLTFEGCDDNWLMLATNGHDLTILEDLTFNSTAVNWVGDHANTNITIGGDVINKNGSTGMYGTMRLGNVGVKSISIGGDIVFAKGNRLQVSVTAVEGTTYSTANFNATGIAKFDNHTARLDFGRSSSNGNEAFYAIGGLSGENTGAIISTAAEKSSNGVISTIVLTNASDYSFAGKITVPTYASDGGTVDNVLNNTINIVMNGSGKQVLSGDNDFNGYVQVEKGTLLLNTAEGAQHGKLKLNGGKFGSTSSAVFASADINGGALIWNNNESFGAGLVEKIVIDGEMKKLTNDKIAIDFANLNAEGLVEEGWIDLIEATSLTGFDILNANNDFTAQNLVDAQANFQWAGDNSNGYTLQVSFAAVPEAETMAMLFGAIALGFVAWRRRK